MKRKKYLKSISLFAGLFLFLSIALPNALKVQAAGTTTISYTLSKTSIAAGDTFDINVNVANVENLYGASIDFRFDQTLFSVEDIVRGAIWPATNVKSEIKNDQRSNGSISFYATQLGGTPAINSTSNTLFVIKAKALKAGSSILKTISDGSALSVTGNNVCIKLASPAAQAIGYTASASTIAIQNMVPPVLNSITFDKASPQPVDTSIIVTANATGGSNGLLYKFNLFNGITWTVVKDYSSSNAYTWTPNKLGTYKFSVHVKDSKSNAAYDSYKVIDYIVTAGKPDIISITASKASPQPTGTSIILTANATGGDNGLLYKFNMYDGATWTVVNDYASANAYTWTPSKAGTYKFVVHVKDAKSTAAYDDYLSIEYVVTVGSPDITGISVSKASPQPAGTSIILTANANGGANGLLYKFNMYDGTTWTVVKDYASVNSYTWTPNKAGTYKIVVHVKDAKSIAAYDDYQSIEYAVTIGKPDITAITASKVSPQPAGTSIILTANATGGANGLLYKFNMYDGATWTVVKDYSSASAFTWTPTKAGTYKFSVHVKDANSTAAYDDYLVIEYLVTAAISKPDITAITTSKVSPQPAGTSIILTANATGGANGLLYKFNMYDGATWTVVKDFSSASAYTWTPTKASTYKFSVHVKDANSTAAYDDYLVIEYIITAAISKPDITAITVSTASPQYVGTPIDLTANATGGANGLLYKFNMYDGTSWTVVKDYSSASTFAWTPTKAGTYKFSVHVKDANSTASYDDYFVIEYTIAAKPDVTGVTVTKSSPQPIGTSIILTANATGGANGLLYKYNMFDGATWTVVKDYSSVANYTWTPTKAGNYIFSVHVKDSKSTDLYDDYIVLNYTIN